MLIRAVEHNMATFQSFLMLYVDKEGKTGEYNE